MNIYPDSFEIKTGFDKVRQLIADKCLSSLGKELVDEISFSDNMTVISLELQLTDEFVRILNSDAAFPADYYTDTRRSLHRIKPEGTFLDEQELFDLKRSLQTIYDVVKFFRQEESAENYPALKSLSGDIPVFPQLISLIDSILDKYGRMKDNASPELLQIRKELTATVNSISRNLQSILRSAQAEGLVDKDVTPAMRDGRLVIPVAPAFKRRIKGIVHDESASGKTVFIEPETVVEANNRVRELESEERREIVRILTAFTDNVRPLTEDILSSYSFLAKVDFIRAKALFAKEMNCIKPHLLPYPALDWVQAVHPLLQRSLERQGKKVVPLDIELTTDRRLIIISGPNAGGKSVCLKTVGLLQYMLQCGLLIPVRENSHTGLFSKLFIDIGDEQSIENDLSTYSSHLANMKFFVRNCDARTLLLIDEFGSGTEPVIGGAIAEALLERFNNNGSFGVITTHYGNLKQYAKEHKGVVNGAMLYDRHQMQPLFSLSIGLPGSSFAIDIARKTGIPEDVIAEASSKVGADYVNADKYLQDIVRDRRYWEAKREKIRRQEKQLEDIIVQHETALETINSQRKELLKAAKIEAQQLLSETNARIEKTIRDIKEAQADKERTREARRELDTFKETLLNSNFEHNEEASQSVKRSAHIKERTKNKKKQTKNKEKPMVTEIAVGDNVRMKGQTATGKVIDIQGKQATAIFGSIKSVISLDKLEKIGLSDVKKATRNVSLLSSQTADAIHEKRLNFKQEIDVRGMRGDEALQTVMYYIDDAILTGVSSVRILHGTGNGILRQIIREYLSSASAVKRFSDEDVRFGGAGITVVELS
jgi:DNA mismatch repair protein MutS2